MKILHIPDNANPTAGVPTPAPAASGFETERVESLEHVAKSILEKIQAMEERIKLLESTSSPAVVSGGSMDSPPVAAGNDAKEKPPAISFDADSMKKNLLAKMWKHLNDQAAA